MSPSPTIGRRPDGSIDHAACAAAGTRAPTVALLARAWIGRLGWDRPWTRLRAAWSYTRVRRASLRLEVPAGRIPDCPACRDSCCRSPHLVSLRLTDIALLHDAGLGWAVSEPGDRTPIYTRHPELRAAESRPAFRDFPVLRHTEQGACVFLDPSARCSIYALRPLACRAFPYRLGDDLESVRYSTGCPSSRTDGSPEEQAALAAAVAANYDAKARDLLMLDFNRAQVVALGLGAYLPEVERGRRFAAVMERTRQKD